METEQALSMAESLAEKEILFLQEEKYDHAFKLAEKRKEIFSRLEKEELSPVTGIKKKTAPPASDSGNAVSRG